MTELMEIDKRTPIEIALDMDENGMVSAKKLYDFLDLNPKNYSRWCSRNIVNDSVNTENVDYFVLPSEEQNNPNPTTDYRISIRLAEDLCMLSRSKRGNEARKYFRKTEEALVKSVMLMRSKYTELENRQEKLEHLIGEIVKTISTTKPVKIKLVPNNRLSDRGIVLQNRIKRLSNYLYNDGVKGVSIKHAISYAINEMQSKYGVNFNAYVKSYKKQFKMKEMPFRMYVIDYYDELLDLFEKTLDYVEYQYDIDKEEKTDEIYLI